MNPYCRDCGELLESGQVILCAHCVEVLRGNAEPITEPTYLYRAYDALGVLLYVGISKSFPVRLGAHTHDSSWWLLVERISIERYSTRALAGHAERKAIQEEHPLCNVVHRGGTR